MANWKKTARSKLLADTHPYVIMTDQNMLPRSSKDEQLIFGFPITTKVESALSYTEGEDPVYENNEGVVVRVCTNQPTSFDVKFLGHYLYTIPDEIMEDIENALIRRAGLTHRMTGEASENWNRANLEEEIRRRDSIIAGLQDKIRDLNDVRDTMTAELRQARDRIEDLENGNSVGTSTAPEDTTHIESDTGMSAADQVRNAIVPEEDATNTLAEAFADALRRHDLGRTAPPPEPENEQVECEDTIADAPENEPVVDLTAGLDPSRDYDAAIIKAIGILGRRPKTPSMKTTKAGTRHQWNDIGIMEDYIKLYDELTVGEMGMVYQCQPRQVKKVYEMARQVVARG